MTSLVANSFNQTTNYSVTALMDNVDFSNCYIGYGGPGYGYFNGYVDEFRAYARSLSSQEVLGLWMAGCNSLGSTSSRLSTFGSLVDPSGLQMYYPFNQSSAVNYQAPLRLLNGAFQRQLIPTNGAYLFPYISYWSFSANAKFYLYNGTGGNAYTYRLPSAVTQYVVISSVAGGGTTTMTQNITVNVNPGDTTSYMLFFTAFPLDNQYNGAHTLSVSLGAQTVLNNVSFVVSSNSVPYSSFAVPCSLKTTGNYPLTFALTNPSSVTNSNVAITNIRVQPANDLGVGYQVVDPSGLALYYPFNVSDQGGLVTDVVDYAAGTAAVSDPSTYTGYAAIETRMNLSGTGCLSLSNGGYVSKTKTVTLTPSGFTMCGWFRCTSIMSAVATPIVPLISLIGASGAGNITVGFVNDTFNIDFSCNGTQTPEFVSTQTLNANTWNFFAVTAAYQTSGPIGTLYTFYVNDAVVTIKGAWPAQSTYSKVNIGSPGAVGFRGYVDDVRVYNYALSTQDVAAVWSYGSLAQTKYGGLVDPAGLQVYYPYEMGTYSNAFTVFNTMTAYNGTFRPSTSSQVPITNGVSTANPAMSYWNVALGTGARYVVANGTNMYAYGLPSGVSQYLAVSSGGAGSTTTFSQTVMFTTPTSAAQPTQFALNFCVFPRDGSYNAAQTLSVSVGGTVLLNNATFSVSSGTVGYTSFSLPYTLSMTGYYPVVFAFSNRTDVSSTLCVTNVSVLPTGSLDAVARVYQAMDNSGLVLYYPLDTTVGATSNYATGAAVVDAVPYPATLSLATAASSATAPTPTTGGGCLALFGSISPILRLGVFTLPVVPVKPANGQAGVTVSCWFNPSATQCANSTLFYLTSATSSPYIQCSYQGANAWLNISSSPGKQYLSWSRRIVPNSWNMVTYSVVYNALATDGSNAFHQYYLNGALMTSLPGPWPVQGSAASFTTNLLGNRPTYDASFSGFLDEFRVYNRALSAQDVYSMWLYGTNAMGTSPVSNLVDATGMQLYYPFNQNTLSAIYRANVTVDVSAVGATTLQLTCSTSGSTYYTLKYYRKTATGVGMTTAVTTTTFQDTTVTADTSYAYVFRPYDESAALGIETTTAWTSPVAALTLGTPSKTFNSFVLPLTSTSKAFYYATVARTTSTGTTTLPYTVRNTDTSFVDVLSTPIASQVSYVLTPYNAMGVAGPTVSTGNLALVPQITFNGYTSVSSTAISFLVGGSGVSYAYFKVQRNTDGVLNPTFYSSKVGDASFTDVGSFSFDSSYSYVITPYNASDVSGASVVSTPVSTSTAVFFGQYTNISTSQLTVNYVYGTTFNYVKIARKTGNVVGQYTRLPAKQTYYIDTSGLSPIVSYQYVIVPYDAADISSDPITTPPVSVTPTVTLGSMVVGTTDISMTLLSNQTFYQVSVARIAKGVAISGTTLPISQMTYRDVDLSGTLFFADTSYAYSVVPYNAQGVPGSTLVTAAVSFPAGVSIGTTQLTASSASVTFTNVRKNAYVYVTTITSGVNGTPTKLLPGATSYTDTRTVFSPNTSYSYKFVPYNVLDVSNVAASATTSAMSPSASVTFSAFQACTNTNIVFTFSDATKFNYVSIQRLVNDAPVGIPVPQSPGVTTFTDSGSFNSVAKYSYVITPYNVLGVAGQPATTTAISLGPSVKYVSYTGTDSSGVRVNFSGNLTFQYVTVATMVNGTQSGIQQLANGASYVDISNMNCNNQYYFIITPYNTLGVVGPPISTPAMSPVPVVKYGVISVSTNAMSMNFLDALSYYDVSVSRITAGVYGAYTGLPPHQTTYTDTGIFTADTSYAYAVIPYNVLNGTGTAIVGTVVSPPATVAFGSYTAVTTSNVAFTFASTVANTTNKNMYNVSVTPIVNGVLGTTPVPLSKGVTSYNDTASALYTTDISYSYVITPYNAVGVAGSPLYTSAVSVTPTVPSYTVTYDTCSATITFASNTTYSYLTITEVSGGQAGVPVQSPVNALVYTDYNANNQNVVYSYQIVAYNCLGGSSGTSTTGSYMIAPRNPMVSVTTVGVLTNTMNLTFTLGSPNFDVSVALISGGVQGAWYPVAHSVLSYSATGTYTTDLSYAFALLPRNLLGTAGSIVYSNPVSLPTTVPTYVLSSDTSSVTITFTPVGTGYYFLKVAEISGGVLGPYVSLPPKATVYTCLTSNNPDVVYAYNFITYNKLEYTSGGGTTSSISVVPTIAVDSTSITNNAVTVNFSASAKYYDVILTLIINGGMGPTVVTSPNATSYTFNMSYDTDISYAVAMTPRNVLGVQGTTKYTEALSLAPTVPSYTLTSTSSAVSLVFSNPSSYYTLRIAEIAGGVMGSYSPLLPNVTTYTSPTATNPDVSYAYCVMAYNKLDASSAVTTTAAISVVPTLTLGSTSITTTALTVNYSSAANYYDVALALITNGSMGSTVYATPNATSYVFNGDFDTDISYAVMLTPRNILGVFGTTQYTAALSVAPYVPSYSFTQDTSSITMAFNNNNAYYYLSIAEVSGGSVGAYKKQPVNASVYTDYSANNTDVSYSYRVIAYNVLDASSAPVVVNQTYSVVPVVISNAMTISTTSISVNLLNKSTFYDVSVALITDGVLGAWDMSVVPPNTEFYTLSGSYSTDSSYAFALLPYNVVGGTGSVVYTYPAVSVAPTVPSYTLTSTVDSVTLTLANATSYYYVAVAEISGGVIGAYEQQPNNATTYTSTYATNPDVSYAYSVMAYNKLDAVSAVTTTTAISVVPTLSIGSSSITTSAITVIFSDPVNYYDVALALITQGNMGATVYTPANATSYVFNGLFNTDTSYVVAITPRNVVGGLGTTQYTAALSVTPVVPSYTFSSTPNSVSITFTSNVPYYYLTVAEISGGVLGPAVKQPINATTYTDTGATSPNVSYTYSVVSYNELDASNGAITTTAYSVVPVVSILSVAATLTTISASFSNKSTFNYVSVTLYTAGIAGSATPLDVGATTYSVDGTYSTDISYVLAVTPYNVLGAAGTAIRSSPFSAIPPSAPTYTLLYDLSSITVQLTNSATYNYATLARTANGMNDVNTTLTTKATQYYDTNVMASKVYSYTLTPYNVANGAGPPTTTTLVSPLPRVSISTVVSNPSVNQFTFVDLSTFYDVSIALIMNGTRGAYYVYYPNGMSTFTDISTNYSVTGSFQYSITPRNALSILGTNVLSNVSTVPISGSLTTLTVVDNNQMSMYYPFNTTVFSSADARTATVVDTSGMNTYYTF